MCEPTTIMAITAAGSLAVQGAAAAKQRKARLAANQQSATWAQEDFMGAVADGRVAQQQTIDDANSEVSARVQQADAEKASIAAIAGEYADGNNTARLQNEAAVAAGQDVGTIQTNRDRRLAEVGKDVTRARQDMQRGIQRNNVGGRAARFGMYAGMAGTALSIGSQYAQTQAGTKVPAGKPKPISYGYTG